MFLVSPVGKLPAITNLRQPNRIKLENEGIKSFISGKKSMSGSFLDPHCYAILTVPQD
jgi:hypothetical protein